MAITLVSAPDEFALSKGGKMNYTFSGSGRIESPGIKAETAVLFSPNNPVQVGDVMELHWNNQTVTMTAVLDPTRPGEFPAGNGSPEYVSSLVPYFAGYHRIRQDFTVEAITGVPFSILQLTARKPGAAYTIDPFNSVAGFSVSGANPAGGNPIIRVRYGVYVEVYLQKAGTDGIDESDFELIGGGQHVEADDDGVMLYDVGDLLHGYLSADTPGFNGTGGQPAINSHRKYYVAYAEAWGETIEPGLITTDQVRHVYLGGADFDHRASGGYSLVNVVKGAAVNKDRALRFGPMTRRVYVDEPAWLTFINVRGDTPSSVTLRVTLTFDDNTTAVETGIQALSPYPKGEKLCYPIGIAQRDLLSKVPAGKHLKEYSAVLLCGSDAYSDAYRFIVDYQQRPYRRYFAYQNSLGAFDCITTYGKGSSELQRFYDQAERILPAIYAPSAAQFVDFNVRRQRQFDVASGWQELSDLIRWDDFYCSTVRYQVTGEKAVAIGITSKQIKEFKDGDNTFAHQFSYSPLRQDEYYSEDFEEVVETPPIIAVPVGSVTIQPTLPVLTRDPTINDAVRELTETDVAKFKLVASRPNPETLGFLTPQTGANVFRRVDLPVPFAQLSGRPTTRNGYGITDVPTVAEAGDLASDKAFQQIKKLVWFNPFAVSWTGDEEPE